MNKTYRKKVKKGLENDFQKHALNKFVKSYKEARDKAFKDVNLNKLKKDISDIKSFSIKNIDLLFNEFKKNAEKNGVKVYLAKDAEEARNIILKIARKNKVKLITKSKSMTSEEIYLNHFLENNGLEVIETDLGEWIIQLRKEGPSHMVMPAIHLSRQEVAKLFSEKFNMDINPDSIEEMVRLARKNLREKFIESQMGITGANFAIAESGSIGIVENESNARIVSTFPPIHVALIGIDKLIPSFEDALVILKGLTKNATAQIISTYVSWIGGSVECLSTKGNKKQLHIIFLNNGRSLIAKDDVFKEVLKCVRCGGCANVCPIYKTIGGHAYGHVYIGAIGLILTYFYHRVPYTYDLIQNCLNCYACKDVCIANIDLPKLIVKLRTKQENKSIINKNISRILKNRKLFHSLLKLATYIQKSVKDSKGYIRHLPFAIINPKEFRKIPSLADKPFRDIFIKKEVKQPKMKIALFTGCMQDFVYTKHLEDAVDFLYKYDIQVNFPLEQGCCGLPAYIMGEEEAARDIAINNINGFDLEKYDYIITLCASCASHIKNNYPLLLSNKNLNFSKKLIYFSTFIHKFIPVYKKSSDKYRIAYHAPCHLCRGLNGEHLNSLKVLEDIGIKIVNYGDEEVCCGLGGSYSFKFPEISSEIVMDKINKIIEKKTNVLITDCPGCILQLKGFVERKKIPLTVKHLSEILG